MNGKTIATNKNAYFEYFVEETFEAGIELEGAEVKSLRGGKVNMQDSFCLISSGQAYLKNMHIAVYDNAGKFNSHDSKRDRKLLLHKKQIAQIQGKVSQKGYAFVPLKLYFKDALVKVEVGLCKGKHTYDKKQVIKEKDIKIKTEREIKEYI